MRVSKQFAVLVGLVVALGGCVAETETEPSQLLEGLTVLDFTDTSISLAFREADEVIYMEAVRGQQVPEAYQNDPRTLPYEMDARFTDEDGFTFYLQQGGHDFVMPEWEERMNRQLADRTPVHGSNEDDFRMATEASRTLFEDVADQIGAEAATQLVPEIESIFRYASIAHKQFEQRNADRLETIRLKGLDEEPTFEVPTADGDIAYGTTGPEDAYYTCAAAASYQLTLHADSLDGLPGTADGYHSATARHWFNGAGICGSTLSVHNSCNHGRCGTEMPVVGQSGYKLFGAGVLNAYHCSGDYAWGSDDDWGADGGHNCHDDSRIQMHNFVFEGAARGRFRWCDGGDRDHDISVDVLFVELDQDGYPRFSTSSNRGYGSEGGAGEQCEYFNSCPANYMGVNDGCDCTTNGTTCGDPDCDQAATQTTTSTSTAQCDYTLGCPDYYMGAGDGCDCYADGTLCPDPDCG